MTSAVEKEVITRLGIGRSLARAGAGFASENPATGTVIARVRRSASADYEATVAAAQAAFLKWREVPAPQRGAMVRALGAELRRHKDLLGTLISLETGKIKAEADGEVQEMIDIADFAVGLSRQLYGRTMHSERRQHRMFEQWHPLGPVGVITAFNFRTYILDKPMLIPYSVVIGERHEQLKRPSLPRRRQGPPVFGGVALA